MLHNRSDAEIAFDCLSHKQYSALVKYLERNKTNSWVVEVASLKLSRGNPPIYREVIVSSHASGAYDERDRDKAKKVLAGLVDFLD